MHRSQTLSFTSLFFTLFITLFACLLSALNPTVGLAQDRLVIKPITSAPVPEKSVYTDPSDPDKLAAAQSLAQWLSRANGRAIGVAPFPASSTAPGFYVGLLSGPQIASQNTVIDNAAYTIDITDSGQVYIDSADVGAGLLMAVYDFLQNDLGYTFWSFNESSLPSQKDPGFTLKTGKRKVTPAFSQLFLRNREADSMPGDFRFITRSHFGPRFTGTHNLYALISDFGRSNPQVYPMNSLGDRQPNDLHLCYTAQGLPEAVADNISDAVRRRQGNVKDWIYFAGPGSGIGGYCQCDQCNRIYEQESWTDPDGHVYKGYSGALIRMMNKACEILEKKHPGIKVGTLAGMSFDGPPGMTRPAANLVIKLQRSRVDCLHPITQSTKGKSFIHKLNRWSLVAPGRVYISEPAVNFQDMLAPFPNLKSLCENIDFYKQAQIAGLEIQGNHFSPGSDAVVMKNWVISRKMWDPSLDTDTLIKTFCDGYYGPASGAVQKYLAALHNAVTIPKPIEITELDEPNKSYLSLTLASELASLLDEAALIARPIPEPFGRRVAELRAGLDASRLALSTSLLVEEGKLVRADLGRDMLDQALTTIQNLRYGSPRESVSHPWFAQWLLQNAGGPIVRLSAGQTQAVVASVQAEIWQVTYAGVPVIQNALGLPRGSAEFIEKSPSQSTYLGPVGIGPQVSSSPWLSKTNIQLPSQDKLLFTTELQQLGTNKFPPVGTQTDYPAPPNDKIIVEVLDRGQFIPVTFRPGDSKVSMGNFLAVRVRYSRFPLVITDTYQAVLRPMTGELSHDRLTGTVRVHVVIPDVTTTVDTFTKAVQREIILSEPVK